MATNKEVIQYYGRSSQTVHRNNLMTAEVDDKEAKSFHYFESPEHPKSLEKWKNQFTSSNIAFDRSRHFTPGLMVCSDTVHRSESFIPKVSAPVTLKELPSPKSLLNKKRATNKRRLENSGLPFNAALAHLRDIKAKQGKFDWGCINRKLIFEPLPQQEIINDSEDPVDLTPLRDLETEIEQEEQITNAADSKIILEKDEEFKFRPMLTFDHYKNQPEFQSNPSKRLFYFEEE